MNFCDPLHAGLAVLVALLSFMVGAALVGLILPACFALPANGLHEKCASER
jgi:hypothetical protein